MPIFFLFFVRSAFKGIATSALMISHHFFSLVYFFEEPPRPPLPPPTGKYSPACSVPHLGKQNMKHSLFRKDRTGHKVQSRDISVQFDSVVNFGVECLPVAGGYSHLLYVFTTYLIVFAYMYTPACICIHVYTCMYLNTSI